VLLLLEIAHFGPFRQIPKDLWYRRESSGFSVERQRARLFSDAKPLPVYGRLPYWLPHTAALAWRALRGRSQGGQLGPLTGLEMAASHAIRCAKGSRRRSRRRARA